MANLFNRRSPKWQYVLHFWLQPEFKWCSALLLRASLERMHVLRSSLTSRERQTGTLGVGTSSLPLWQKSMEEFYMFNLLWQTLNVSRTQLYSCVFSQWLERRNTEYHGVQMIRGLACRRLRSLVYVANPHNSALSGDSLSHSPSLWPILTASLFTRPTVYYPAIWLGHMLWYFLQVFLAPYTPYFQKTLFSCPRKLSMRTSTPGDLVHNPASWASSPSIRSHRILELYY